MNVKELKEFLAQLPKEADGWNVCFTCYDDDAIYPVDGISECCHEFSEEERVEMEKHGLTENFILLSFGEPNMEEPKEETED